MGEDDVARKAEVACFQQGYNQAVLDILSLWMNLEDPQEFINAVKGLRNVCFDSSPSNPS